MNKKCLYFMDRMNKFLRAVLNIVKRILIFFAVFLVYHLIGFAVFPVDETANKLLAPPWYPFAGIALAIYFSCKPKRKKEKKTLSQLSNDTSIVEPSIPTRPITTIPVQAQTAHTEIDVQSIIQEEEDWRREQRGLSKIENELYKIDVMDGHAFEFWCANLLRSNGFYNVSVTPGSNDQGVDIVAQKEEIHYAIQCKCFSSDLGNKPVQEVFAGKEMYNCQVAVVMTNRHFTSGAKALAEKTRVLLWDREKIIEMLKNQ